MGRIVRLGQEGGPSLSITPDGKTLTWFVPPSLPDPVRLWVSVDNAARKLQAEGRGGIESPPWVQAGYLYRWDMTAGPDDALQTSLWADARGGFPLTETTGAPTPTKAPAPGAAENAIVTSGGIPTPFLLGGAALAAWLLFGRR